MPGFWFKSGPHAEVAGKLCSWVVGVLKDLGVEDVESAGATKPQPLFDYASVDALTDRILAGISGWKIDVADRRYQTWYANFAELVQLLRL